MLAGPTSRRLKENGESRRGHEKAPARPGTFDGLYNPWAYCHHPERRGELVIYIGDGSREDAVVLDWNERRGQALIWTRSDPRRVVMISMLLSRRAKRCACTGRGRPPVGISRSARARRRLKGSGTLLAA